VIVQGREQAERWRHRWPAFRWFYSTNELKGDESRNWLVSLHANCSRIYSQGEAEGRSAFYWIHYKQEFNRQLAFWMDRLASFYHKSLPAEGIIFSTCPSVHCSSVCLLLVNAIFWKLMNRFCFKLAQVVHGARSWDGQLQGSGGQRSRSHEAEIRFGGVASFSTPLGPVAFLIFKQTRAKSCISL